MLPSYSEINRMLESMSVTSRRNRNAQPAKVLKLLLDQAYGRRKQGLNNDDEIDKNVYKLSRKLEFIKVRDNPDGSNTPKKYIDQNKLRDFSKLMFFRPVDIKKTVNKLNKNSTFSDEEKAILAEMTKMGLITNRDELNYPLEIVRKFLTEYVYLMKDFNNYKHETCLFGPKGNRECSYLANMGKERKAENNKKMFKVG